MVEVEFNYQNEITIIKANPDDSFKTKVEQFINKTSLDINNLSFLNNGKNLNLDEKLDNIMNESGKNIKKLIILVSSINNNENTNIIKSNDIICPQCKELCKYDIIGHKIKLFECKNKHIIKNIRLHEYEKTHYIDISKIKCDKCQKEKKSNELYTCLECNINICSSCKSIHDKEHLIINYENKNYICKKHNQNFIKYCRDCKKNMCLLCSDEHQNHDI